MKTLQEVVDAIDKKIQETNDVEVFWDRQDELSTEQISKYIKGQSDEVNEEIRELSRDHIMELETQGRETVVEEFKDELVLIEDKFDDYETSDIIQELETMGYEIEYPPVDMNMKDLLRNTPNPVSHYDTGYSMSADSWNWSDAQVRLERMKIKKHLGIFETSAYDYNLDQMIMQATYGGQLLIYFKLDISNFQNIDEVKTIIFKNSQIGVVDHFNGSGDVLDATIKETITLPFDANNLFLEKEIKYNWTYSIAGMMSDWADSTELEFSTVITGEIESSPANELIASEKIYNQRYKEGGCSLGDMDISRHRNTEYVNNYPCGNRCNDCGTFWID